MTAIGALIGLLVSVLLIIKKVAPTYSLIAGAIVGGLLGGLPLTDTVRVMTEGVKDVTPAVIRILTAGVLSGVLIKTGAASARWVRGVCFLHWHSPRCCCVPLAYLSMWQ